ncbi:hypothetical protein [Streptomyces odontomachi]|uniref:hypothetical protein n=1 Tax=Streptomyces odontomachi TaxID=2944940 RepID=UPI00210CA2CF|nr:hypothetical protein [Streptomyces sp. ODS25]
MRRVLALLVCLSVAAVAAAGQGGGVARAAQADDAITSGSYALSAPATGQDAYGIAVADAADGAVHYAQDAPCQVMVKNGAQETDLAAGYSTVSTGANSLTGTCTLTTAHGSAFRFTDTYTVQDDTGAFRLARSVAVTATAAADEGFGSRFVLGPRDAGGMADYRFFSPGVWYDHNDYAGTDAIGGDPGDAYFYYRETRAALPLTMMQDAAGGATLALAHVDAPADSSDASAGSDTSTDWLVSAAFRYASIGAQRTPATSLAVVYPGTEGNAVYDAPAGTTFRHRSNPVTDGFTQKYTMVIKAGRSDGFDAAMRGTWRYFFDLFAPQAQAAPDAQVYTAGINLLKSYAAQGTGRGVPFRTALPAGTPADGDWNYQMGYVGEQIPLGYELLRYGTEHGDPTATQQGTAILDFWARTSMTPSGLPATWFDEAAGGGYRNDPRYWSSPQPSYLRQVSDGMEGMVEAARYLRGRGTPRTSWENLATGYGNWLLRNQHADGSFARAYAYDGSETYPSTLNTTDPVRFLVDLSFLTGDQQYLDAARRAGAFARSTISGPFHYVGGTADEERTVIDKEAGVQALNAYLALYDATKDPAWLTAATAAADYTETWMYAWNFAVRPGGPASWQQRTAALGTTGLGLIKTGMSAADSYLSYTADDYYRLYLFTGDRHYHDVARLLAGATKQSTEVGGTIGYGQPGLQEEATTVAGFVHAPTDPGTGTSWWLPWLTVSQLEPYADLQDMFGSMTIDDIDALPLSQRQQINETYPHRGTPTGQGTTDVTNAGFESPGAYTTGGQVPGWRTWTPDGGASADAAFTESYGDSHSGSWHLALYKTGPFALSAYQDLPLANGTYQITAWVESSGGLRETQMEVHNHTSPDAFLKAPIAPTSGGYQQVSLTATVTTGLLTVGFWADDPTGGHWVRVDDVQVTAQ